MPCFLRSLILHQQVLDLNHGRLLHLLVALIEVRLAFLVYRGALSGCGQGRGWLWLCEHVDFNICLTHTRSQLSISQVKDFEFTYLPLGLLREDLLSGASCEWCYLPALA